MDMELTNIKDYVALEKERLKDKIAASGRTYRLDIFQVGDNPASNAYIRGKIKDCNEVGIKANLHKFSEDSDNDLEHELIQEMSDAIKEESDGVILQLPVPECINSKDIIERVCERKQSADIDGFVYQNHNPCTPQGIIDWLEFNNINLDGANVVIIGRSDIVGKPLARMMLEKNATVTLCHSHTDKMKLYDYCDIADIIVCAVGKPKFLKLYSFFAEDTMIVDVGINKDENGKLCGDVESTLWEEIPGCYVTPVPGGVGLLTRLRLLKNIIGE